MLHSAPHLQLFLDATKGGLALYLRRFAHITRKAIKFFRAILFLVQRTDSHRHRLTFCCSTLNTIDPATLWHKKQQSNGDAFAVVFAAQ